MSSPNSAPKRVVPGEKLRSAEKVARIPVKVVPAETPLAKPAWLKIKLPSRSQQEKALARLSATPPDVFNHNLETIPRLYKQARPGADYAWSLKLLKLFKDVHPRVPTKSGLMLGLGETNEEIVAVMKDLRAHGVNMLTLGQYLQPSPHHLPVDRYVTPAEFDELKHVGEALGFAHVASGPFVRSSYHADLQASGVVSP